MSGKSIISNAYLEDIGDAIRYKKGSDNTYYPSQMGDAIRSIEGIVPAGTLEIDANGTYDVTEYAEAVVDVPGPVITSLTVTEDGTYEVPSGVDGYDPVTVNTGIDALRSEIDSAVEVSGCDPLVEGLTALTTYANEVTGASDTTLSDAVGRLCEGYGGSDGKDVVITETVTSTSQLAQQILKGFEPSASYDLCLKTASNPTLNNIICGLYVYKYSESSFIGGGLRYRNGSYGSVYVTTSYDAATTIGDIYTVYRTT